MERNLLVNPELENKIVRNNQGKVICSNVNHIIQIKINYPEMSTEDIINKYNQMLWDNPLDSNESESSMRLEGFSNDSFETAIIEESDYFRGQIWKKLTRLDSYKQSDFFKYSDIIIKIPPKFSWEWIEKDLPRIVPNHPYYSDEYGYGSKTLKRVLESLAIYHEDLQTFNSIGFISSNLLLYLTEEDTFWMMNYLLDSTMISKWISQDRWNINITWYIFQKLLSTKINDVYTSLWREEVSPAYYASTWFMTLFWSKFNTEVSVKIFDRLFKDGYVWWFRIALSILKLKSESIINSIFEDIIMTLSQNLE